MLLPSPVALLDALADCLESGDTLLEALEKVGTAGGAAAIWAQQVRRSVRTEAAVADALRAANVLEDDELTFFPALSADGGPVAGRGPSPGAIASPGAALRAVALRRRRGLARRRAIGWGLVVPFALGALTVVLDPLPDLISGEAFLAPLFRGLVGFAALTLAIALGVPALLRNRRARPRVLASCAVVPGLRGLAALYAEEELTTGLAPFVDGGELSDAGLTATATLVGWSPLGERLRIAAQTVRVPSRSLPMAGLEALAPTLSLDTGLAIVGGVASKRLAERLAQRGDAIALLLTARLRRAARVAAYALVVLLSLGSVVGMVSRGLPGMFTLPGGTTTPDQKQLDDLLKQLEQ